MRRTAALLAAMTAISLLAVEMAHAITKICDTPTCKDTDKRDTLIGKPIDNVTYGYDKGDTIRHHTGRWRTRPGPDLRRLWPLRDRPRGRQQ